MTADIAVAILFDALWLALGGATLFAVSSKVVPRSAAAFLSVYLVASMFIGASLPQQLVSGSDATSVPNVLTWLLFGAGLGYLGYLSSRAAGTASTTSLLFALAAFASLVLAACLPGTGRLNLGMEGVAFTIGGLLTILALGVLATYLIVRYRAKTTVSTWFAAVLPFILTIGAAVLLVFRGNEGQPMPASSDRATEQPTSIVPCVANTGAAPSAPGPIRLDSNDGHRDSILGDGDLSISPVALGKWATAKATRGVDAGKWYWEVRVSCNSPGAGQFLIGIATSGASLTDYIGSDRYGWSYYSTSGGSGKLHSGKLAPYGAQYGKPGEVIGIALDATDRNVSFFLNGVSQGVAYDRVLAGTPLYPAITDYMGTAGTVTATANFGATPFAEPVPTGYVAYSESARERR